MENGKTNFLPALLGVLLLIVLALGLFFLSSKNAQKNSLSTENASSLSENTVPTTQPTQSVVNPAQITLTITSPSDQAKFTNKTVLVKGQTVKGAEVAINEQNVVADTNGNFSASVNLEEGDNYIDIVATDLNGETAEKELVVFYTPQP